MACNRLFVGDSITAGSGIEHPYARLLDGVNAGVIGMRTVTALLSFDESIRPFLAPGQTVHILLGTNDAVFLQLPVATWEANIIALLDRMRGDGRKFVISAPGPVAAWPGASVWLNAYTQACVGLWTLPDVYPGALFGLANPPIDLLDGVHPSQAGHDQMAAILAPKLGAVA